MKECDRIIESIEHFYGHLTGIEGDNLIYGFIKSYTIGKDAMLTIE